MAFLAFQILELWEQGKVAYIWQRIWHTIKKHMENKLETQLGTLSWTLGTCEGNKIPKTQNLFKLPQP